MIENDAACPDNLVNFGYSVEDMAKGFAFFTSAARVEMVFAKYGRERLLREFEPFLKCNAHPRALAALRLLRGEITIEGFLFS